MVTKQLIVKLVFDRWNTLLKNCDAILSNLSDVQLMQEVSPGKNRGIYILGHLVAVHDDLLVLLNLGDKKYPWLFDIFVKSPDKSVKEIPTVHELRVIWKKQLDALKPVLAGISTDEWFGKHNGVSDEDFINEPHRNKLNIIITRTTHLAYHVGQLILLK